jgi:hypothetical protein
MLMKSIDLAVIKPGKVRFVKIDISEAKYIRDRYFRKWRSIQSKVCGRVTRRDRYPTVCPSHLRKHRLHRSSEHPQASLDTFRAFKALCHSAMNIVVFEYMLIN